MSEPTGAVTYDPAADRLRTDETYTIVEDGRARTLRLRVARGKIEDQPKESACAT